jgi:hypothetical protein
LLGLFFDPENGGGVSEEHFASIFRVSELAKQSSARYLLHAGFLLDSFFYHEDSSNVSEEHFASIFRVEE